MRSNITGKVSRVLVVVAALGALAGCQSFDMQRRIPWKVPGDEQPIASVIAFWTNAVIERAGAPPVRGFGGKVYFFPQGAEQAVKVAGTMVVYVFDDTNLDPDAAPTPLRKFVFTNEQLAGTLTETKMGPAYNVLLPWDDLDGETEKLSVICRYIPPEGPSVVSEQARVFLPGSLHKDGTQQAQRNRTSQSASSTSSSTRSSTVILGASSPETRAPSAAQNAQEQAAPRAKGIETFTLDLPRNIGRGLRNDVNASQGRPSRAAGDNGRHGPAQESPPGNQDQQSPITSGGEAFTNAQPTRDNTTETAEATSSASSKSSFQNSLGRFWEQNAIQPPARAGKAIAQLPTPQQDRFEPPSRPAPIGSSAQPATGHDR